LKVQKTMMTGNVEAVFEKASDEDFDYTSLFDDATDKTEAIIDDKPIEHFESFFPSDFDYYQTLIKYLINNQAVDSRDVSFGTDGLIEFINTDELDKVLYDLPPESKPKKKGLFKLTIDKEKVEEAIVKARKKKGEWAEFQVMYDLHPIIRFMMTKLEAHIDKDKALVLKSNKLPSKTRFYIFHGQVSNDLGQSVLSDFFVIGIDDDGVLLADENKWVNLADFIQKYKLNETIYNEEISDADVNSLQENVKDAVLYAKTLYMKIKQDDLTKEMIAKQNSYQEKLKSWERASKKQMELEFENQTTQLVLGKKIKVAKEIDTILNERSQYVKNLTSLNNEAYLKLIGVFYNN
jgi:hypothetical protein